MRSSAAGRLEDASDEALLGGLAAGDASAARALVARYQAQVYGLAVSVLRDRAAAEDVAQEAFVRAWRHATAFDPRKGTVAAWLLRITRNLAIDAVRLRRAGVIDPGLFATLELASNATSVEDAVVTADGAARARHALRQLPAEQCRAVLLAAFYGRTAEEISRSENIPVGTAKTRIRLGLRKIKADFDTSPVPAGARA